MLHLRVGPKINIPGERHHIARLSARFDEQDILAKYGSGQYYCRLNDKKLRKTVATHVFSVYHPDKQPVCDLSLIVDCPENEPYLKWIRRKCDAPTAADTAAVGELAKLAGKVLDQRTAAPAPANSLTEATTQLVLGMSKGRDELAAKLAELAPGTDSLKSLDRAVELLKKLQPAADPTVDPIEALDRAVDLLKKLQPPPRASEKNPLEQVTAMLDLVNKLKEIMPSAATDSGGSDLSSIAVIVREVAELLKNPLTIAMNMWAASKTHTSATNTCAACVAHSVPASRMPISG